MLCVSHVKFWIDFFSVGRKFKFKLNFYEEKLAGIRYLGAKRGTPDILVSNVFVKNMNLRNFILFSCTKGTDRAQLEQKR